MKHIQCVSVSNLRLGSATNSLTFLQGVEKETVNVCIRSPRQKRSQDVRVANRVQDLESSSHLRKILERKASSVVSLPSPMTWSRRMMLKPNRARSGAKARGTHQVHPP